MRFLKSHGSKVHDFFYILTLKKTFCKFVSMPIGFNIPPQECQVPPSLGYRILLRNSVFRDLNYSLGYNFQSFSKDFIS